jgi:hypothetical protein
VPTLEHRAPRPVVSLGKQEQWAVMLALVALTVPVRMPVLMSMAASTAVPMTLVR